MTNETATNQTPQYSGSTALLQTLLAVFNQHIKDIVNKELTAALQNASTLALMDEKLEEKMRVIAQDAASNAVKDHEFEECHHDEDDVDGFIATYLRRHDYVDGGNIDDKISDAVDEKLGETDFDDYITESTLDEKVEEKLTDLLKTANISISLGS